VGGPSHPSRPLSTPRLCIGRSARRSSFLRERRREAGRIPYLKTPDAYSARGMRNIRETPLKERFEAASKDFATTYARKSRNARAGVRPYPGAEFLEDVYAAASGHGLFVEALWAYFRTLHGPHQIDGPRKRFGENDPLRPRGTGGVGAERIKRALSWGVVASLLACALVLGQGLYQTPKYEAEACVLVGQQEQSERAPRIHPIPNATSGLQTLTLTVAKVVPTKPVARAVVERLNLPKGSAEEVLGNMSVERVPGTMFIDITYEDSEAKRAQLVANAIGAVLSQKVGEVNLGDKVITATLWKPATLPKAPVSPKPLRNAAIALVATASLSLAVGTLLWAVRNR
jgi:capsular polysaccharide biosynthesis protein